MLDIEQRVKALEKRARIDAERWQAVFGDTKALSLIIDAIGAAISASNRPLLRTIIKSLETCEDAARIQNEHGLTIERIRMSRKFFESRLRKADEGDSTPPVGGAPRRTR
jgi:hypothetical protein